MTPDAPGPERGDPFAILLLGDFRGAGPGMEGGAGGHGVAASSGEADSSGEASPSGATGPSGEAAPGGEGAPLASRTPRMVDRDDLDSVLAALAPRVRVPSGGPGQPELEVELRCMEDFHPDRLLRHIRARVAPSDAGNGARVDAGDPASGTDGDGGESGGTAGGGAPDGGQAPGGGGLLDQILDETAGPPRERRLGGRGSDGGGYGGRGGGGGLPGSPVPGLDLESFVEEVAARHAEPRDDTGAQAAREAMDRSRARQLGRLLAHPDFQALEARWRGAELLCRRLDTGPELKIFVVQATSAELLRGMADGSLHDFLAESSRAILDGVPWAVAVPEHAFGDSAGELEALAALSERAGSWPTAFLLEATPSLVEAAARFRASPEDGGPWTRIASGTGGARLGLALPRFLLREPWCPRENPVETLEFRELEEGRSPERGELVSGHPGVLGALCLGLAFRQAGWQMRAGAVNRLKGMPIALHRGPHGVEALPPVDALPEAHSAAGLVELGFMPLVGRAGEGTVAVASFRSAAGQALEGPWV
ncbi:MAG: hypothetical protein EA352_08815 [Gemmatimonadales bacterium]|nr:MAG: hypothetical protein EA352_08815 [Gemmatimonadales bacterium]